MLINLEKTKVNFKKIYKEQDFIKASTELYDYKISYIISTFKIMKELIIIQLSTMTIEVQLK